MSMDLSQLRRLNALELERYCGNSPSCTIQEQNALAELVLAPVEVRLVEPQPRYDVTLAEVVRSCTGHYKTFRHLRALVTNKLAARSSSQGFNRLSVLFGGIYVGEPEDLRNYLRNPEAKPRLLYPVDGLGQKVAEIVFVGNSERKA